VLNNHVLVLNQNYEPLSVCSVRRALILIFRGRAHSVELDERVVHSVSQQWTVPSVVRLERYVRTPGRRVVLSKRNILKRDNHQCQYCGSADRKMTIDHVIPRKFGGGETWENLVCACMACNTMKGDQRPEQVGLQLRRRPKRPNNITYIRTFIGISDHRWKPYLFVE
jgi:5-methylcytosine-specific restriction endonuclease McrA